MSNFVFMDYFIAFPKDTFCVLRQLQTSKIEDDCCERLKC